MIKNNNGGIQRELEIDKEMDSCSSDELVNHYMEPEIWGEGGVNY